MKPLASLDASAIRSVLFDIDETLTTQGKLTAEAYAALEALRRAGRRTVAVTGRPAGWCDHIARMWPVDAVVGENGAFYFFFGENKLHQRFADDEEVRQRSSSATRGTTRRLSLSSTIRSASRTCSVSPGACRARRSTSRGAPPAPASPSWRRTFSPDGLARLMEWLAYPAIGVIVGFFAGLLGIGRGVAPLPLLVLVFRAHGLPHEHLLPIPLGPGPALLGFT